MFKFTRNTPTWDNLVKKNLEVLLALFWELGSQRMALNWWWSWWSFVLVRYASFNTFRQNSNNSDSPKWFEQCHRFQKLSRVTPSLIKCKPCCFTHHYHYTLNQKLLLHFLILENQNLPSNPHFTKEVHDPVVQKGKAQCLDHVLQNQL